MAEAIPNGEAVDQRRLIADPEGYIKELDLDGKIGEIFPALERSKGVMQSPIKHAEGAVFTHTLMTFTKLDEETPSDKVFGPITDPHERLLIIYALMYHDLGKKERNEGRDQGERLDHVKISLEHAKADLADKLSEEDLALVLELIEKHEYIADAVHISPKINKLHQLFTIGGDLRKGRLQLKCMECDLLGRLRGGNEQQQKQMVEEDFALAERNIGIYQLLLEQEAAGATFPLNKISAEVRSRIEALIASAR